MINILRYINFNRQSVAANVLSLVVGLTCCLLIAIWAVPEVQTDRCFAKLDRISIASGQQGATTFFGAPPAVAPFAMGGCPQVEQAARVTVGQRTLRVSRGAFGIVSMMSDPELFGIFDFSFVAGVPFGAADVDRCVVSRSTAERLFGTADAVDSLLTVGERTFRVCGVFEDLPRNVTLMRNRNLSGIAVLVPLASSDRHAELDELWYDNSYATYLLLHPDADATALAAALTARSHDARSDTGLDIALRPLKDEYLVYQGNGGRVWLMTGIALLILSIACINFVNLATAAFSRQTVAVGIRKVMGASRARLVADYLLQTLLIVLGSLALALVAAHLLTPYFSLMIGKQVDFGAIANPAVLLAMAGAVVLAVLLSGLYPALYLSSFRPLGVLHGRTAATGGGRLRTMLVTMQMMASVVLIVCCIVVKMQIMAFGSADLGYNRSDIICITSLNETQFGRLGVLRDRLQADPAVEAMSQSTATLTGWSPSGIGFGWDGMPDDSRPLVTFNFCDADFADTYQLRFAAGRFMREGESACVINRSFADLLAATDTAVIGRTITRGSAGLTVVGIVDGLRHGDYNELQGPYIIMPPAYFYGNGCLSVRFAAGTDVRAFYERVCRRRLRRRAAGPLPRRHARPLPPGRARDGPHGDLLCRSGRGGAVHRPLRSGHVHGRAPAQGDWHPPRLRSLGGQRHRAADELVRLADAGRSGRRLSAGLCADAQLAFELCRPHQPVGLDVRGGGGIRAGRGRSHHSLAHSAGGAHQPVGVPAHRVGAPPRQTDTHLEEREIIVQNT